MQERAKPKKVLRVINSASGQFIEEPMTPEKKNKFGFKGKLKKKHHHSWRMRFKSKFIQFSQSFHVHRLIALSRFKSVYNMRYQVEQTSERAFIWMKMKKLICCCQNQNGRSIHNSKKSNQRNVHANWNWVQQKSFSNHWCQRRRKSKFIWFQSNWQIIVTTFCIAPEFHVKTPVLFCLDDKREWHTNKPVYRLFWIFIFLFFEFQFWKRKTKQIAKQLLFESYRYSF